MEETLPQAVDLVIEIAENDLKTLKTNKVRMLANSVNTLFARFFILIYSLVRYSLPFRKSNALFMASEIIACAIRN